MSTSPSTPKTSTIFLNIFNNNPYIKNSPEYFEVINILELNNIEYQQLFDNENNTVSFVMSSPHIKNKYKFSNENTNKKKLEFF